MLKLEYDEEKDVIRVGEAEFAYYTQSKKQWLYHVLYCNKRSELLGGKPSREKNKAIGDFLGCSYNRLFEHFSKLQAAKWVGPVYPIIKKLATNYYCRGKFDPGLIRQVNRNKKVLLETYNDGLYNLLPIVASTGKTPQQLKAEYKGKWKQISNNKLGRNIAVALHITRGGDLTSTAPSTLLKRLPGYSETMLEYLKNNHKGKWGSKEALRLGLLYLDTERMAEQLGEKVSPKWSARRVKEEHDRMAKRINEKMYSPEPYSVMKNIKVRELEHKGYKAVLLDSPALVYHEGTTMGHCVGSYSGSCANGDYLVYAITKDGDKTSTLGLVRVDGRVKFHQHYGRFNEAVTDADECGLSNLVIDALNKGENQ